MSTPNANANAVPSKLVLISELPHIRNGDKVRFLGCVDNYDLTTHGLILSHPSTSDVPQQAFAHANVAHVLESTQRTALEKGAWINIIGYVVSKKKVKGARAQIVKVDVVVLWEAKEINLQEYERSIEMRKVAERLFTTPSRTNAQLHPE